ncbi:ankyrin repeat domain-containing protein [Kitasatospora sp. NPDC008115]|uniref:ankyrin repeat domain-containing protein n=1 Tax=Kitasatospora sp. NPDC008115 TaxID=3364022 RepID=UPI0036E1CA2F
MSGVRDDGWAGIGRGWTDVEDVRRRLDRGADPERWGGGRPLHRAAAFGSPEVVAEIARRVGDVDALDNGVTALWEAVAHRRPEIARVLAEAGADPWRRSLGGWSPGRLSLAGPTPDLFPARVGEHLTEAERAAADEARLLIAALGRSVQDGTGLACVAGLDADEAVRRLAAVPVPDEEIEEVLEDPDEFDPEETEEIVGVTTVPGGCVVTQPWGYTPQAPEVLSRLSVGTVCYGLYANPKSGNQGSIARDGVIVAHDLHPGGAPDVGDDSAEVLTDFLYGGAPAAYACAFTGLRPTDARALGGAPDRWVRLPAE